MMNWIDIAGALIVVVSTLVGVFKGFVRDALMLVAWLVAVWFAYIFAAPGAAYSEPYIEAYIEHPLLRLLLAFAAVFVVVLGVLTLFCHLLRRLVNASGLDKVDRSLGLIFGVLRGVLIVALLILFVQGIGFGGKFGWQQSLLIEYITPLTETLRGFLPEDLSEFFKYGQRASDSVGEAGTEVLEQIEQPEG